jgi:Uma2 family endonuclease
MNPRNPSTPDAPTPVWDIVFPTYILDPVDDASDAARCRSALDLVAESIRWHFRERHDFYVGKRTAIYYCLGQLLTGKYRGPDFFFVWNADGRKERRDWVVWEEGGQYPHLIIELLSPKQAEPDQTFRKNLYEQVFRIPEYFLYDPDSRRLEGWRFSKGVFKPMEPDNRGWLWSKQLNLYLGTWEGAVQEIDGPWLRFFDVHGRLIPCGTETPEIGMNSGRAQLSGN